MPTAPPDEPPETAQNPRQSVRHIHPLPHHTFTMKTAHRLYCEVFRALKPICQTPPDIVCIFVWILFKSTTSPW